MSLEDPLFPVSITVGGTGQSYKIAAFPKEMHANQSFILQATLAKDAASGGGAFDISSSTATLYCSGWKNNIDPVTLVTGVITDSGSGTDDRVTFTVPKDLIPESLGGLPLRKPGNSVFYFILEDSDSILQFFQQVNIIDTNYTLSGDVDSSPNVIVPDKNDLGTVLEVNLNTPPGSPAFEDAYIVGTSPTGDWVGQNNDLAVFNGSSWVFYDTVEGNFVFDANTSQQQIFNGTTWGPTAAVTYSDGESINDNNGNELIKFGVTSSAVSEVKITNKATGAGPLISASSGDTNADLNLAGQAAGKVSLNDGADNTKRLLFDVSGITTGTDRTVTVPDASGTLLFNVVEDTTPQYGGIMDSNSFQSRLSKGADVASGTALTLGTDGNYFDITGTTTITSIGTLGIGTQVTLHFDAILTLTHHATDLIIPGGANITTAAGDEFTFIEYASGDWRCVSYALASGEAIVGGAGGSGNFPSDTDRADVTSAHTVVLSDLDENLIIGSSTSADFDITLDVSLFSTLNEPWMIVNESDYIARVVVSNTSTMTLNSQYTDHYVSPSQTITFSGDTSTNCRMIAGV